MLSFCVSHVHKLRFCTAHYSKLRALKVYKNDFCKEDFVLELKQICPIKVFLPAEVLGHWETVHNHNSDIYCCLVPIDRTFEWPFFDYCSGNKKCAQKMGSKLRKSRRHSLYWKNLPFLIRTQHENMSLQWRWKVWGERKVPELLSVFNSDRSNSLTN